MAMIDITTNVGCINKCLYCPQSSFTSEYLKRSNVLKFSFENFKICIDKVPTEVGLSFAGFSEPWLNPDCTKMILYAYKKGHKQLNASVTLIGMTLQDIDLLEEIPFSDFRVHLPGNYKYEEFNMDENYMNVLKKMLKSKIKAAYHFHGSKPHQKIESLIGNKAFRILTIPRSVCIPNVVDIHLPRKKSGEISCSYDFELRFNELLPNGDLLLCCQDFGMKHILGNLLTQDYEPIFKNEEFSKIKAGLKDNSSEIICRYCLVSRNTKRGSAYYLNLLNTDIIILVCKTRASLKRAPFSNNRIIRAILRLLGINKFKIDFGRETLDN